MNSIIRCFLLFLLAIGWIGGIVTACSDSSSQLPITTDSGDADSDDVDTGQDGQADDGDVTTDPDDAGADTSEPNLCDYEAIYRTVPGFYAGPLPRYQVPAPNFEMMAIVLESEPMYLEVELTTSEPRGRLKVELTTVESIEPDWPTVGQSVRVTFGCSPLGTWCDNDSYLSIDSDDGVRIFEGGQVSDIEYMNQEINENFMLRYDITPSGDQCNESKALSDELLCEWSVTPVHLELLGTDIHLPSGETQVVELDGRRYLLNALKVQDVEDTCPPSDTILDASYAYLVAIKP